LQVKEIIIYCQPLLCFFKLPPFERASGPGFLLMLLNLNLNFDKENLK